jgi:ribonucleoside-diphosphate reductase alpha chain
MIKPRPGPVVFGKSIKERTPWGSLYVTLNFDGAKPFEVFIVVGKSGSELTAMTEALARTISIGLRSGCRLEDFIDTLKGLSGKEVWMFDYDEEHTIRSLPDAIARLLEKLIERDTTPHKEEAEKLNVQHPSESPPPSDVQNTPHDTNMICPECGAPMEPISGCAYCFSCGYSPCK